MRIDVDMSYVLANGKVGHVRAFHVGSEDVPAYYTGFVGRHAAQWRPDGVHIDIPAWTIVRKTRKQMSVK